MATFSTNKTKKNEIIYNCDYCYFNTCKKTDYNRHILTQKHLSNISATNDSVKNETDDTTKQYHKCSCCNKIYSDRSGLWRHQKNVKIQKKKKITPKKILLSQQKKNKIKPKKNCQN